MSRAGHFRQHPKSVNVKAESLKAVKKDKLKVMTITQKSHKKGCNPVTMKDPRKSEGNEIRVKMNWQ